MTLFPTHTANIKCQNDINVKNIHFLQSEKSRKIKACFVKSIDEAIEIQCLYVAALKANLETRFSKREAVHKQLEVVQLCAS